MQHWEYAQLVWTGGETEGARRVAFTHHEPWTPLGSDEFWATLRRLGEEGWELVSALPDTTRGSVQGWELYFKRPLP